MGQTSAEIIQLIESSILSNILNYYQGMIFAFLNDFELSCDKYYFRYFFKKINNFQWKK